MLTILGAANLAVIRTNIALQNNLILGNGILGGSGILTIGTAIANTFTTTVNNGSLNMTNPVQYNLASVTYNVNYNTTSNINGTTTAKLLPNGAELPPTSYFLYIRTVNDNNTACSSVMQGASANIVSLVTATHYLPI